MAIISSGQLALQDAGTNASGASYYLETNMSSGSTALTIRVGTRTIENSDVFYGFDSTLSGTIYGYKTSQTSNSGTGRIGRGFDDTNFSVTYSGGVQGSGFLGDPDWFDINGPEFGGSGESWFPSRNVSGVHLGSDSAALGSITTDSFTGGDGNTYEIHHIGWFNNASNTYPNGSVLDTQAEGNWLMFTLKGTSTNPPNTDDSFYSIEINGQEYLRSDVTETTTTNSSASVDSNGAGYYREWLWSAGQISDSELTSIGTTGSRTFKVKSAASVTLNNGVAEEFGGADSSDVKLSDYYKTPGAGAFAHNTTGIPTSGEIKFSDFLAKTKVDIITTIHTTTWTSAYTTGGGYFYASGYLASGAIPNASMTDTTISSFQSHSNAVISALYNFNNTITFSVATNGSAKTWTNSGWTTLKVWTGQSNNSGTPTFTMNRSAATFTVSSNGTTNAIAVWSLSGTYPFATYFGTSNTSCYLELE